jgi:predicted nucleic acid-binding protein
VTLAFLFDEGPTQRQVQSILKAADLVAPWLWRLEVTNAVLVRERQKRLSAAEAARLLELLDEITIELIAEPVGRTATNLAQLSRPHQLSTYDAVYLDLALRQDLPLFTVDRNLREAAKRVGARLIEPDVPLVRAARPPR